METHRQKKGIINTTTVLITVISTIVMGFAGYTVSQFGIINSNIKTHEDKDEVIYQQVAASSATIVEMNKRFDRLDEGNADTRNKLNLIIEKIR